MPLISATKARVLLAEDIMRHHWFQCKPSQKALNSRSSRSLRFWGSSIISLLRGWQEEQYREGDGEVGSS